MALQWITNGVEKEFDLPFDSVGSYHKPICYGVEKGIIAKLDNCPFWLYENQYKHTANGLREILTRMAEDFGANTIEMRYWEKDKDMDISEMVSFSDSGTGTWDFEKHQWAIRPTFRFRWLNVTDEYDEYKDLAPEQIFNTDLTLEELLHGKKEVEVKPGVYQQLLF